MEQHRPSHKTRQQRPYPRISKPATWLLVCAIPIFFSAAAHSAIGCNVNTNSVNFGTYDSFSTSSQNATGSIHINCNPDNTSYTVALDGGLYGTITNRRMHSTHTNDFLEYNLYTDASYTVIWGNGTGGSVTVAGTGDNILTVYGRAGAGQNVSIGAYSDSITVTVTF